MSNYFDGIKVGDKIWSASSLFTDVIEINSGILKVYLGEGDTCYCNMGGFQCYPNGFVFGKGQSFFWDEVKITPPPRPKQKEKKVVELWADVYEKSDTYKGPLNIDGKVLNFKKDKDSTPMFLNPIGLASVKIEWEEK